MARQCETCVMATIHRDPNNLTAHTLLCRAHPPSASALQVPSPNGRSIALTTITTWPVVQATDWCGEHVARGAEWAGEGGLGSVGPSA